MNKELFLKKLQNAQSFMGLFESVEDIRREFSLENNELDGAFILLAWYEYVCYEGSAFVLFERDGKLYEVNGGHCSCNGLESQWQPEETSPEVLLHRLNHGRLGWDSMHDEETFGPTLRRMLERW